MWQRNKGITAGYVGLTKPMRNFPAEDIKFMFVKNVPDCKKLREELSENYMRSMSMTKRDLVVKIAKETQIKQYDVVRIVQMILDSIADETAVGNTVELRNFGVFKVITCKSRKARNPKRPDKEIIIPPRAVVKFRTGKKLKKRLGQLNPESFK